MSEFYTYNDWVEKFQPIKNHITKYDQLHFETYGEEQDYVFAQPNENVWTEVDGDDGSYIIAGRHFVNRYQYYVTEQPWTDEFVEVPTWVYRQCDCATEENDFIKDPDCTECEEGMIDIPCETVEDLVQLYGPEANIIRKETNE